MGQHRKPRKFRRVGKHTAPSQVEVMAQRAGKTFPAVAIVGALAVASPAPPQAGHRPERAPSADQVAHFIRGTGAAVRDALGSPLDLKTPLARLHVARMTATARQGQEERQAHRALEYTVRPGDTLAAVAFRFYGLARMWRWLFQVNRAMIDSPNVIFPGQVLTIPRQVPASFRIVRTDAGDATKNRPRRPVGPALGAHAAAPEGNLGCSALEALWRDAGGAPPAAVTAASVAMAESSGEQFATGPFGERGYWQINPIHGPLSTYSSSGNARAAVIISDDGTNWSPWTTFVDGAYAGKC
jgi:hypothetical protein